MKSIKRIKLFFQEVHHAIKTKNKQALKYGFKKTFIGSKYTDGLLYKTFIYVMLFSLGYVYLYPMLYMISNSLMSMSDIISVSVRWIPSSLNWDNYRIIWEDLNYPRALRDALILATLPALSATASSAIVGYGFARFRLPFKKTLMALMIMAFIIPPQITMLPTFRMYANYELLGSVRAFVYPALLAQGLNGPIYILIFYSFFKTIPKSLIESAQLDGASAFKAFTKIVLPLAIPSIIIVFLFSFVWYYNETYLSGLFLRGSDMMTLPLRVSQYINQYTEIYPAGSRARELFQAVSLAGNILALLPLLILYFFTQRHFVESIERTGITGE